MFMGNSMSQPTETVQSTPIVTKYWCYYCEAEVTNPSSDMKCPICSSVAIQQITNENDPRGHDVFTVQSENNEPQPQLPTITPPNTNPNTQISNFSFNNGALNITMINHTNLVWNRLNNNLQNIFQMMAQNGQEEIKATPQQLSLLQMGDVQECIICQQEGGEGLKLGCGHTFHNQCIMPWLDRKNNCPTCRVVLKRQ